MTNYDQYCCIECEEHITWEVFNYSTENFSVPLCRHHQNWIRNIESTNETVDLYFALKIRGVPAVLEKYDGYKHIDIAIPEAKVNIEVDGAQHNFNQRQAFADLQRTYFSFLKGYVTFRIPNILIHRYLDDTADYITEMLNENNKRNWNKKKISYRN
jgi:hypothetical protein